jgi:hypothetical protein
MFSTADVRRVMRFWLEIWCFGGQAGVGLWVEDWMALTGN